MNWQDTRLLDLKSLSGTSGTETVDLPASGWLSSMDIRFDAKSSETGRCNLISIVDALTKIEVVHSGTQVIKSFNGRVARGIGFLDDRKIAHQWKAGAVNYNQWAYVPINFGRRKRDTEYGIDLSRLVDPKLKVEWDCTLTDPVTGYGFHSTPAAKLTVLTQILKDPPMAPKGYIKTSQVKEYTLEAGTIEDVNMPLGNPFRRILVRPRNWDTSSGVYDAYSPDYLLESITLDINDGEKRPVVLKDYDFMASYLRDYGSARYSERDAFYATNNCFLRPFGWVMSAIAQCQTYSYKQNQQNSMAPCGHIDTVDSDGNPVGSEQRGVWEAEGVCVEELIPIAFDLDGFEHLLETRDLSKVKLEIKGYSTISYTSKCYVYLEELVTQ